jgi:hypothetical protein
MSPVLLLWTKRGRTKRTLEREDSKDSTSNVEMVAGQETFIVGTGDDTVREVRASSKQKQLLLWRWLRTCWTDELRFMGWSLPSPERSKHVVWSFFKKYCSKKLMETHATDTGPSKRFVLCHLFHPSKGFKTRIVSQPKLLIDTGALSKNQSDISCWTLLSGSRVVSVPDSRKLYNI